MKTSRQKLALLGLMIVFMVSAGSCQGIIPVTLTMPSPAAPTPTPVTVSLPVVSVAEPVTSPTVAIENIYPPIFTAPPAATVLPSPIPTERQVMFGTEAPQIMLLFTGVIVPARCVQAAIDRRGDASYVYDEVRELISSADLAVGTLNASLSDLSTPTGCTETYLLVGDSRSAVAAAAAGFDVMSVATNHIKNCNGASCRNYFDQAFLDTLENLRANDILPVGAGVNMAQALQPVVVEVQGVRFGFVSLGMIEPMAFAAEDRPGIAPLSDDNLRSAIQAARQVADVVIVLPHWGPEDDIDPTKEQLQYARLAVEAGADVVVGNHTHVLQPIQEIDGVDVFYGLGNFIFDQNWDLAHQQGVILRVYFYGTNYTGFDLIFTHVDGDGTVHLADEAEAAGIWQRIEEANARLK